jgi:transcription initiation factor TFIID subunit 12
MSCSGGGAIEDGVGGTGIAPVPGGEEGGGSTSIVNNNEFTAVDNNLSNPQAAQNQLQPPAISMAALNGFNPQQLTMMQQMMALQQAGMLPQMMGMLGMPGIANAGGVVGQPQQQQQQQQPQNQSQQQQQLQQQQQQQPPSQDGLN